MQPNVLLVQQVHARSVCATAEIILHAWSELYTLASCYTGRSSDIYWKRKISWLLCMWMKKQCLNITILYRELLQVTHIQRLIESLTLLLQPIEVHWWLGVTCLCLYNYYHWLGSQLYPEEVSHIITCTALRQSRNTWPLQISSTRWVSRL